VAVKGTVPTTSVNVEKKNSYCGPGCKCTSCKNLEHSDLDISLDSSFVDFTCVTTLEDDSDSEQDTDLEEDIFVDPTDNVLQ
jgi:hypothetical protein